MTIVAAASAWGCAPGHIAWEDGDDQLRTALWVDIAPHLSAAGEARWVFLSNGIFDCNLPDYDDPGDQLLAEERYIASTRREEAHHLLYTLEQPLGGGDWEGAWHLGTGDGGRWASASYVRVEEVVVTGGTALAPTYGVVEATCEIDEDPSAGVEVSRHDDEILKGRFSLSVSEVSGRFEATRCDAEDDLVQVLLRSGMSSSLCPGVR